MLSLLGKAAGLEDGLKGSTSAFKGLKPATPLDVAGEDDVDSLAKLPEDADDEGRAIVPCPTMGDLDFR